MEHVLLVHKDEPDVVWIRVLDSDVDLSASCVGKTGYAEMKWRCSHCRDATYDVGAMSVASLTRHLRVWYVLYVICFSTLLTQSLPAIIWIPNT